MNRALGHLLAVLPQFLLVAGLAVREEWVLATGIPVVLQVRPYDPMDPFSGRYLGTPLAIERLDLAKLPHDEGLFARDEVWVVLAPGEKFWEPVAVRAARAELAQGQVQLRAAVEPRQQEGGELRVRYPTGRFYIPERGKDPTGWRPEGERRPELALRVRVTAGGGASVEDLLVDGVPYAQWNR